MARPSFLEEYDLTYDDLLKLHEDCLHIDQLAEDLNVCRKTLRDHLKKAGLSKKDIKFKPRKHYKKYSQLAEWVRQNPNVRLPNNVPAIQELTGLSRFVIHHYLYRRLEEYYEYVKKNWVTFLKAHRHKKVLVFNEKRIPILAIKKELLTIDKFSLKLTITFIFRDGTRKQVYIPKKYFESVIQNHIQKGE